MNNVYAAGLFDGEGTVTMTVITAGKNRVPVVSLSSTTYELVKFMQDTYGGHIATLKRNPEKNWKQAWQWQATHNRALNVLSELTPYLLEPEKKRRADLLLSRYKSVTPRNGKYTPELLEARRDLEREFFNHSSSS